MWIVKTPYFQIKIDLDRNNQCVTFKTKIEVGVYFRGIHQLRAKMELKFYAKTTIHQQALPANFRTGFCGSDNSKFWGLRSMWAMLFTFRNWSARAKEKKNVIID